MDAAILYLVVYTLHVEFWSHVMGSMDTRQEVISYVPPIMDAPMSADGSKLINAGTIYINELAWNEQYRMKAGLVSISDKDNAYFDKVEQEMGVTMTGALLSLARSVTT